MFMFNRNAHKVPCYSTVACLNINSCVGDITPHDVVGEVRLQDVEIGIDSNLKKEKNHNKNC